MIEKDELWKVCSFHDNVKSVISRICYKLGYDVREEYKGKDWRADVVVLVEQKMYAFEIQTSRQNLEKTLNRQNKYIRDNIIGCWLFEKEPKQKEELESLPLFRISNDENLTVSLKDRNKIPLEEFIPYFLNDKIKFCQVVNPQSLEIRFIEMKCWKCWHTNHIYYIGDLTSSCNAKIFQGDIEMWDSNKLIFEPEIVTAVMKFVEKHKELNLATIKERYSLTVDKKYRSFGCSKCDSIFGDWFVRGAIIDSWYGDGVINKLIIPKKLINFDMKMELPHWCHPGE